jgi:hypothetical protein
MTSRCFPPCKTLCTLSRDQICHYIRFCHLTSLEPGSSSYQFSPLGCEVVHVGWNLLGLALFVKHLVRPADHHLTAPTYEHRGDNPCTPHASQFVYTTYHDLKVKQSVKQFVIYFKQIYKSIHVHHTYLSLYTPHIYHNFNILLSNLPSALNKYINQSVTYTHVYLNSIYW